MATYYIGTSGWTYNDWMENFYPRSLAKARWLEYYTQHFNCVEVNATYYRNFGKEVFAKWRHQAPSNFKYILKTHKIITHQKLLKNVEDDITNFEQSAFLLQEKLGLILLQLPPHLPYVIDRLNTALGFFSKPHHVVVEFRNKQWLTLETKALLRLHGSIFCATDSPTMKLHNWLTASTAYIRLHGSEKWYDYNYSDQELKNLVLFVKQLEASTIYIIFNNTFSAYAVHNAIRLKELL